MGKVKDSIYNFLVRKNENVRYEYERYVMEHTIEHYENRMKHWKILFKLNWHYRVKKNTTPMLYWDIADNKVEDIENKQDSIIDIKRNNANVVVKQCVEKYSPKSESQIHQRPEPFHFVKALLPYDVISFDIFDTLLLRPFEKPVDLFDVVGKRLNYPAIFVGYKQGRREAEKEARDLKEQEKGTREVTIFEIYDVLEKKLGIDSKLGASVEIETEKDYLFANPYMKVVFDILRAHNKTIILTSDMYIPGEILEKIVKNCGYQGYEKMYVSCDYRCDKKNGELFRRVLSDYHDKKIIHVGDNYISDFQSPKKLGIEAKHYKNVNEIGKSHRPNWMSELVGSAYSGLVNAYIHNGVTTYPFFYEYGFIYGGLYVLGFCEWIYERAKKDNIDKIIFLARDGDILQKIFNKKHSDISNEYIYWSRFANLKYQAEINRDAFVKRVVDQKVRSSLKTELQDVFISFGFEIDDDILKEYGLGKNTLICESTQQSLKKCLYDNWELVCEQFKREEQQINDEIKMIIGNVDKIAVVDVGWTGSGPLGFRNYVNKNILPNCDIRCWMAGGVGNYGTGTSVLPYYMDETIETYLFSPLHNKRNAQIHDKENVAVANNAVFEIFTQTQYPSFVGKKENGSYIFDIPENENYEMIGLVHKGIMDFCDLYWETFSKDPYFYRVPGFDAYRPFAKIAFEKEFFEKNFRDVIYGYGLSGSQAEQRIETIGERVDEHYRKKGAK